MTEEKASGIWIGPTKCDEERVAREKDTENAWNILGPCYKVILSSPQLILVFLKLQNSMDTIKISLVLKKVNQGEGLPKTFGYCLFRVRNQTPTIS